jgi:tRNA(Ile)-lysidine synthase
MTLLDQVASTLRQRVRLPRGARVLAAVSGGADSVALAWLLSALAERGLLVLAGIGHLNHQLRGAAADEDESFCAALAARLGVPVRSSSADVYALAAARKESIEAAARRTRYAALATFAADLDAQWIATGHTLDDQAETVLLRLLRGAGSRGLSGIRSVRGRIIRPMLDCRRAGVRAYLATRDEPFREDASNADARFARNRVRLELLPVIDRLSPCGLEALARTAALSADDEDFLSEAAIVAASSIVLTDADGVQLRRAALRTLAPSIARRVIRAAIEDALPGRELVRSEASRLTSRHLEAVWHLVQGQGDGESDLPGVHVEVIGDVVRIGVARAADTMMAPIEWELGVPGAMTFLGTWRISAILGDQTAVAGVETRKALEIAVSRSRVGASVIVRNRRPGDRIKPVGGRGRKKLQDLLVDQKVPRADRDRLPVVVDGNGHVVWVVGVAMADEFRVTAPESEVVIFKAERQ